MGIALDKNGDIYKFNKLSVEKEDSKILKCSTNNLSLKDKLLTAKSLIMVHKPSGRIMCELKLIHAQHFYPLSVIDYANAIKNLLLKKIDTLPIMSVDSHDYNFCDFHCKDCLAVDTRKWAQKELGYTSFDIKTYENVLSEIARYSKQRGCDSVRFEMSGEGNPDMYPYRARIIKHAKENCNMKCVYISSGSRLNEETIDALVKYAYYIRISLPGITNEAYDKYSNQKCSSENKFTYDKAMELIKKLTQKRKEYKREGDLLIGCRTCMRPENGGNYLKAAKQIGDLGADSFQIVKILVPEGMNTKDFKISEETVKELTYLKENYNTLGLQHVQIPGALDYEYYDRKIDEIDKPSQCFSSLVSPILYGSNLVICTHWEKIKDIENSHYARLTGTENELEDIMLNEHACSLRNKVPERCSSCCSIYDNLMMEMIKSQLIMSEDIENIEFMLTY